MAERVDSGLRRRRKALRVPEPICHPVPSGENLGHHPSLALRASFGWEDLKNVPVGPSHDIANACDVVGWNILVKEVAHRVDEDFPWASPMQRLIELFGNESEIEALLEWVARHTAETFCE